MKCPLPRLSRVLPVIVLLFGAGACGKGASATTTGADTPLFLTEAGDRYIVPAGSPLRERLTVAPVVLENIERRLSAPATVEAEPSRLAKISPPVAGRVVKLFVHFGDTVKQGAPLFALDSPDIVAAQSDFLKARSGFAQSERNVARQTDLRDHGIGAERDLEQAKTDRDTAKSELERTSLRLKLLGMSAGTVGGPLTVTSPIAGRVIDLATAPGQYQSDPATVLLTVADLETVWVTASVQEKDVRRVKKDEDAEVIFAAYPGETTAGKVLFVGDLLDPETRAIKVRIALQNPEARFKPGMFATVTFKGAKAPEIVAPTPAVVIRGEKSWIFVEKEPWTFERRSVEVGEQLSATSTGATEDRIAVTKGVSPGERIVIKNAVLLQ